MGKNSINPDLMCKKFIISDDQSVKLLSVTIRVVGRQPAKPNLCLCCFHATKSGFLVIKLKDYLNIHRFFSIQLLIFSYPSFLTYVLGAQKNCLNETVL